MCGLGDSVSLAWQAFAALIQRLPHQPVFAHLTGFSIALCITGQGTNLIGEGNGAFNDICNNKCYVQGRVSLWGAPLSRGGGYASIYNRLQVTQASL